MAIVSRLKMVGGLLLDDWEWPRIDEQQRYRSVEELCYVGKNGAYFVEDSGLCFSVILNMWIIIATAAGLGRMSRLGIERER